MSGLDDILEPPYDDGSYDPDHLDVEIKHHPNIPGFIDPATINIPVSGGVRHDVEETTIRVCRAIIKGDYPDSVKVKMRKYFEEKKYRLIVMEAVLHDITRRDSPKKLKKAAEDLADKIWTKPAHYRLQNNKNKSNKHTFRSAHKQVGIEKIELEKSKSTYSSVASVAGGKLSIESEDEPELTKADVLLKTIDDEMKEARTRFMQDPESIFESLPRLIEQIKEQEPNVNVETISRLLSDFIQHVST